MRWPGFRGRKGRQDGGGDALPVLLPGGDACLTLARFRQHVENLAQVPLGDFDGRTVWMDLLRGAALLDATDVHVEPQPAHALIRLRRDGELWDAGNLPRPLYERLLMALKNLAGMVAYVHSRPQDGRLHVDEPSLSVRAATVPVLHGEKLTLRLLASASRIRSVDDLGMEPRTLEHFLARMGDRRGLTLCVGPAGSGKTTTLYATLLRLHRQWEGRVSVATIEDPVEYEVPAFNQTPVHVERGLTFAAGLRSILRHDPNAILVGEVRDPDTVHTALQAALSGHLVMSTMHGSDAVGGLFRLLEMGIEPEVLGSGLGCIVAQRLVRTVCEDCAVAVDGAVAGGGACPRRGRGCEKCDGLGLRGRTGLFEILEVGPAVQEALRGRVTATALDEQIHSLGFDSLRDDLGRKVARGLVPPDAIL